MLSLRIGEQPIRTRIVENPEAALSVARSTLVCTQRESNTRSSCLTPLYLFHGQTEVAKPLLPRHHPAPSKKSCTQRDGCIGRERTFLRLVTDWKFRPQVESRGALRAYCHADE
ncbi:uncharacterized protein AFUA_3G03340 [Aspergillus fumigatus Af293]